MAKFTIAQYALAQYNALRNNAGKSYAVIATAINSTPCYQPGGSIGKLATDATITVALGDNFITLPASFPVGGRIGDKNFGLFYSKANDTTKRVLDFVYASEMWLLQAVRMTKNVHFTYSVKDDKDKADVCINVRGERVNGSLTAAATHALSTALAIGVGNLVQADIDNIVEQSLKFFEDLDKKAAA